jgi:hypothetical protein
MNPPKSGQHFDTLLINKTLSVNGRISTNTITGRELEVGRIRLTNSNMIEGLSLEKITLQDATITNFFSAHVRSKDILTDQIMANHIETTDIHATKADLPTLVTQTLSSTNATIEDLAATSLATVHLYSNDVQSHTLKTDKLEITYPTINIGTHQLTIPSICDSVFILNCQKDRHIQGLTKMDALSFGASKSKLDYYEEHEFDMDFGTHQIPIQLVRIGRFVTLIVNATIHGTSQTFIPIPFRPHIDLHRHDICIRTSGQLECRCTGGATTSWIIPLDSHTTE